MATKMKTGVKPGWYWLWGSIIAILFFLWMILIPGERIQFATGAMYLVFGISVSLFIPSFGVYLVLKKSRIFPGISAITASWLVTGVVIYSLLYAQHPGSEMTTMAIIREYASLYVWLLVSLAGAYVSMKYTRVVRILGVLLSMVGWVAFIHRLFILMAVGI